MSQQPADLFATSCGATVPLELNVSGPGGAGTERRIFDHPFVLVGRHESNSLHLDDPEVSRRHAYLQQLGGRVFCVDLGSRTGIRWDGEPRPAGWVRPDQKIQIGPFALELARVCPAGVVPGDGTAEHWDPLQDRVGDPATLPQLTVEVGDEVKSRLHLNRVLVLVGSSPDCRVRLRDDRVSKFHCSLVRTSEGVWVIDLLSGNGTWLNDQQIRCSLVKEGDQLQVGPYVLRIRHPDRSTEAPGRDFSEIPAETPMPPAKEAAVLTPELQAELDAAREHQRDAELLRQQLADSQAECDRLREQLCELEVGVAGMAVLQARLEAAEARASELDAVRAERDQWQAETRDLQARLASDSADREQHISRAAADLQAAQMEHERLQTEQQASLHSAEQALARVSELERTLEEMAEGHKTALEEGRTRWESENQALETCLAQERQAHDGAIETAVRDAQAQVGDLKRALTETTEDNKKAFEEARCRWESERQELEARLEQERQNHTGAIEAAIQHSTQQTGARVSELERKLTEAAEGHKAALEEARACWESERQELEARLAQESQTHAEEIEAAVQHSKEQAGVRVSELERILTEMVESHQAALEDTRTRGVSERQELESRLAQERQNRAGLIESAVRDVQARIAAEREDWRQRLEGAELQLVWERKMFQEWSEQARQQSALLNAERNRVAAQLAQAQSFLRVTGEHTPAEAGSSAELERLRQQAAREQVFAEFSTIHQRNPRETDRPRQPSSAEDKPGGEEPHR